MDNDRERDDDRRPEYDDDWDDRAERRAHRSEYPADEFTLPGVSTRTWGGLRRFLDNAVHPKIVIEGTGQSLAAVAGDLTIRQIKQQPFYTDAHWAWTGAKEADDRPVLRMQKKKRQARRVLWALYRGGVPDARRVVHVVCERRDCVNPHHFALMPRGSWQTKARPEGISEQP